MPSTTIVFANHKGGCGKTTSVANTGAALAARGHRVLLIDADPQANLSEAFGVDHEVQGPRLEDTLYRDEALAPWSVDLGHPANTAGGKLDLVPCTAALEAAVSQHVGDPAYARAIDDRLDDPTHDAYDFVLLDTPPGLGPLSSMAMLAADWVIVPARPADFDVAGAIKLATLIGGALTTLNERLRLLGVLICQVDRRWTLSTDTREALAAADVHRLRVEIPFMVRTGAAPRHGAPTVLLEPDCRLSVAYHDLARDLETVLTTEVHA
jgi:chromosome partitioning protein